MRWVKYPDFIKSEQVGWLNKLWYLSRAEISNCIVIELQTPKQTNVFNREARTQPRVSRIVRRLEEQTIIPMLIWKGREGGRGDS